MTVPTPVTLTTLDLTWILVVLLKMKLKLAWEPSKHLDPWDLVLYLRSLPVAAPKLGVQRTLELMRLDKKVLKGQLRLVLLRSLGAGVITADYPEEALLAELQAAAA